MSTPSDIEYFRIREAEERARIETATSVKASDAHRVMADRYADRLWSAEEAVHEANLEDASMVLPSPPIKGL